VVTAPDYLARLRTLGHNAMSARANSLRRDATSKVIGTR
jgi:hypothetical protein